MKFCGRLSVHLYYIGHYQVGAGELVVIPFLKSQGNKMPSLLGSLASRITVQPGTYAVNPIKQGQTLRILDVEGGQVADFISMKFNDPTEYLDCAYTNMISVCFSPKGINNT